MMVIGKRRVPSSSDEDLQSVLDKKRRKEDLFSCQVVTCEFCDEAFINRYNYLVHNANHIIIPLLRQTYFRCQECQHQCRTDRKLRKHMKKRHPHLRTHRRKKHSTDSEDNIASQVNNNNENTNKNEQYIIPDLESKAIEKTNEKVLEVPIENDNLIDPVSINGNSNIGVEIIEIESDDDDDIVDIKDINSHDIEREKIRNRLVFEEEEEDIIKPNGLINDLMSDIKVSVDLEPWMKSIAGQGISGEAALDQEKWSEEWRTMTVSYQELIETQDVRCRYCNETFPDRLSLIKHEPTHMSNKKLLRRPFLCQFCDWYVASDPQGLKKHHKVVHPGKELKPMYTLQPKTCDLCKLKYISKHKHMLNYHHIAYTYTGHSEGKDGMDTIESKDSTEITKKQDMFFQKEPHFQKRVIQVCDMCALFFKNVTNLVYYRSVGEKSVFGERQKCDRCLKQFFSVNLVEMSSRSKERKKDKPLSNMDRLKNIQNRLKMINKIRKFLCAFYC